MPGSSVLQPFAGERYARADLSDVIAPPYDVISPDERAALAQKSPHNIVHLILPEGNGDRYAAAARHHQRWRDERVLVGDPEPSVYVLAQRMKGPGGRVITRVGMLAAVEAEPYDRGRVKPHEKTHAGPKADRLALMRALRATFESIFLIAPDSDGKMREALARAAKGAPTASGNVSSVETSLWRVSGPDAAALATLGGRQPLYIADGHHRYETTLAYRGENPAATHTVGLVVPAEDQGLTVLATHRIIRGKPLEPADVRPMLESNFDVEPLKHTESAQDALVRLGRRGTACIVVLRSTRLGATLRPEAVDRLAASIPEAPVRALDVARIDQLVVTPLQKLTAALQGLEYTPDSAVASAAVGSGASAAVLLNPTSVAQVIAVADARGVMPQKSTFFVPKVPSGLVGMRYDL